MEQIVVTLAQSPWVAVGAIVTVAVIILNIKLNAQDAKFDARFAALEARFAALEARFAALEADWREERRAINEKVTEQEIERRVAQRLRSNPS